jgi:hypothetical protein
VSTPTAITLRITQALATARLHPIMGGFGQHEGMFKVTFRDAHNNSDLTNGIVLPSIPAVGEPVHLKERAHHGRAQTGHVTSRHWHIMTREPEDSEVVILVALD